MQSLFLDTRVLDKAVRERYGLTEEVMMENAAVALERAVVQRLMQITEKPAERRVVILCGSGNNGADGYALARRLAGFGSGGAMPIVPVVILCAEPKSDLCRLQAERAEKCGVRFVRTEAADEAENLIARADCIVDCIFGSGFHGALDEGVAALCLRVNRAKGIRIACDVPTGVRENGSVADGGFCADCTVTMGALKCSLYGDAAKDFVGQVTCENLGVSRMLFESVLIGGAGNAAGVGSTAAAMLLETSDVVLPHRKKKLVNKGSFGHVAVVSGEKIGASCIAGEAALHFGAGLVSLVRLGTAFEKTELPEVSPELMAATDFPANTTAVALGMGLGRTDGTATPYFDWLCAHAEIPCVIDADAFFSDGLRDFLQKRSTDTLGGIVLTPHPKEFQSLLALCGLGNYTISDCVIERPALMETFCRAFPKVVLLVKGANPMIGTFDGAQFKLFVNPLGKNCLAKAGSGDVLAGLICSLLAQGYTPLDATISASLAHALASCRFKNDFALTPLALIDAVSNL